ncbi:pancreatic lipase-related protein 2-like isoform X2 [Limulus polyphemus]|uniref:Pancreatic lipase-related protein 2-like isoform X2 n=1 Tax=Limulus polyphemus TaxID=6850 RepID=A0ABM1T2Y3_LIMPO|nr:pancreatic lipase-related protein 2-like isoform X2 [Limulus polyphemus]
MALPKNVFVALIFCLGIYPRSTFCRTHFSKYDVLLDHSTNYSFAAKGSGKCLGELGCFETGGDFFHPIFRPLNVLPDDREVINVRFYLYTRKSPKDYEELSNSDESKVRKSNFDPTHKTKFIVHGWIDNQLFGYWMRDMKDEFLLHDDYNVIIVDWSGGNGLPYTQATSNTRVVGAEIALLISRLQEWLGVRQEDCHILGHSLGSHVAGYAGERLEKLGRITGLDPAEPYFQHMPPAVRLDPSDATFVDAIHTDSTTILLLGLGMSQEVGHVDFFPNNGKNQPGCKTSKLISFITDGLIEGTRRFIACNHQRAVDFFHYSINHKCAPVGYLCANWEIFLKGQCAECGPDGSRCAILGMRADEYRPFKNDEEPQKLYLKTSGSAPFCLHYYQVLVKLYKPSKSRDERGKLWIALQGSKGSVDLKLSDDVEDLYHGARYTYLATTDKEIGEVQKVTFWWEYSSTIYNPLTWILFRKPHLYIEYIKVTPMNVIDHKARQEMTVSACEDPNEAIYPDTKIAMSFGDHC